jgi:hypothetical protein
MQVYQTLLKILGCGGTRILRVISRAGRPRHQLLFRASSSIHLGNHPIHVRRIVPALSIFECGRDPCSSARFSCGGRNLRTRSRNRGRFLFRRLLFSRAMFGRGLDGSDYFFIPAALTLPGRKHGIRVAGALIDRPSRRNDFAAATRTCTSARSASFDVDAKQLRVVLHLFVDESVYCLRCRKAITKIVQKIETGGTSKTSTPMLKFRINELFAPKEARHIAHCANVGSAKTKTASTAIANNAKTRIFARGFVIGWSMLLFCLGRRALIAQVLRAKTVREENE